MTDKLVAIYEMLRDDPDVRKGWDFGEFFRKERGCGTVGCAIGWASAKGIVAKSEMEDMGYGTMQMIPLHDSWASELGVTEEEFDELFCQVSRGASFGSTTPEDIMKRIHTLVAERGKEGADG